MAQENVAIAKSAYEALSRRDFPSFFDLLDPDVELVLPEGGMNSGILRGAAEMRRFMESWIESFDDFEIHGEKFFETGDHVVAFLRQTGRGRGSGIEVETRFAHVITLREGRAQRIEAFPHREKQAALEAVGLHDRFDQ